MLVRVSKKEDIMRLTQLSTASFHTDIAVGGSKIDGPPGYDSYEWYKEMFMENHLITLLDDCTIVGGAVLFQEKDCLYVGRIFIDPDCFQKGYGTFLMREIERLYSNGKEVRLDTPVWNRRTNQFYKKCGYQEVKRDEESVYYLKQIK